MVEDIDIRIRIDRFQISQKSKIMETKNLIIQLLQGNIPMERAELLAVIYEYFLAEDLQPRIGQESVLVFLDDFQLICEFFGYPLKTCSKSDLLSKVLNPYLEILKVQTAVFTKLNRWLIQRLGQDLDITIARSYTLNDFFKPLMKTMIKQFPSVNIKFLTAIAWTTLERYITKESGRDIKIAEKLALLSTYPNVSGPNFAFDLAFMYLLKPNWDNLLNLVRKKVKKLKESIRVERELMLKEQEAKKIAKQASAQADPVVDAKKQVSLKLNELFGFGYEWTDNRESQIFRALNLLLRRISLREYGHVAAEDIKPIREELEKFLWGEIIGFPEIIAYGMNVKSKFYDPSFRNSDEILAEFIVKGIGEEYKTKFFYTLFDGYRGGADYNTISSNFCTIIKRAKKNQSVY